MAARLGQPVVIETRSGAGGMTGVDVAAKAPADGYTVALGTTGAIVIGPSLTRNPPFVAERDLAPITLAINVQVPIVVPAQSPYRSLQNLLAGAKAQPGKITFGSSGTGGMPHLAGELLNQVAGVQMVHVPYRGGGPVGTALLQAEVDMGMSDMSVFLAHHRAGTMRILAVGSAQRLPYLPDVPTLAESGLADFDFNFWAALFGPAGLPAEIAMRQAEAIGQAMREPGLAARLVDLGVEAKASSPAELDRFFRHELQATREIVRRAGIELE
jgi:tripartite-type tricarboxylate transporter receptor subunit TctC